jgi:hypothetical protein
MLIFQIKIREGYIEKIQLILSSNVDLLLVQITKQNLNLMSPEEGDLSGR